MTRLPVGLIGPLRGREAKTRPLARRRCLGCATGFLDAFRTGYCDRCHREWLAQYRIQLSPPSVYPETGLWLTPVSKSWTIPVTHRKYGNRGWLTWERKSYRPVQVTTLHRPEIQIVL